MPYRKEKWKVELLQSWDLVLNSGEDKCDISRSEPGCQSPYGVRLHTLGEEGFCSVISATTLPAEPGQEGTASVMMKGSGQGYIRIYFYDHDGKRFKEYEMLGKTATSQWQPLVMKFIVPDAVAGLKFALQTLRNDAEVDFDDARLEIAPGAVLENRFLRVKLNPRLGGGISSLYLKEAQFEFTSANSLLKSGGMLNSIIPAVRMPGELLNRSFSWQVLKPGVSLLCQARVTTGSVAGLELTREYSLSPDQPELSVRITLTNHGIQELPVSHRIQNFVNSSPGIYSWPTPDWVTTFHQTGESLNGLNAIIHDLFRAGWQARYYEKSGATLLFEFDVNTVGRIYDYLNLEPRLSTMEWYYRDIRLAPNESHSEMVTIKVLGGQTEFYADAKGLTQKVEKILPVSMPPIPSRAPLPKQFDGYFPYCSTLGNLSQPEMAGANEKSSYSEQFCCLALRLTRRLVDAYVDTIASERLMQGNINRSFRDNDGKHGLGELLEKYDLRFILSALFSLREDIDTEKYMTTKWPKKLAMMKDPDLQQFITEYQHRIPAIFTADELIPQNADVMLKVHEELGKLLPDHIVPFPYLNSSCVDLLPYLPVFLGDWYPIKRASASGRNPWKVYPEFSALVKRAGETPVWFMPQGFAAAGNIYALPDAGEIRLMLHLAAAAGVKGIAWHGFPCYTWPWMMNYSMYRYSLLGGAGQQTPSWKGVQDAGRAFATVGALLCQATPGILPEGFGIECGNYKSANGFYDGAAIRLFALTMPFGQLLLAINQNPKAVEKGIVTLPEESSFDFFSLREISGRSLPLELLPGDARYFFSGSERECLAPAFRTRFRAEAARYLLLADTASADGIAVIDPQNLADRGALQSLLALLEERRILERRITEAPLGNILLALENIRERLDKIDFRLCCALELVVTPEMRENTPRYKRWIPHPDAKFQAIRNRLVKVFADFYRISDHLDVGLGSKDVAPEIPALERESIAVTAAVSTWLDQHPNRAAIDDPYENY
ncbi:MAG: hypothetical protein WCT05_15080 [Lentisphaeria bacterium]